MHILTVNIAHTMTDRIKIAIANTYKCACVLSIASFTSNLGSFQRGISRSYTFRLGISRKWWQIGQTSLLPQILYCMSAFDLYIYCWSWPILIVNLAVGTVSRQIFWPSCYLFLLSQRAHVLNAKTYNKKAQQRSQHTAKCNKLYHLTWNINAWDTVIPLHGRHFVSHLGICNPICIKLLQLMSGVITHNSVKKTKSLY